MDCKSPKSPQKREKSRKNAKSALAHLTIRVPCSEKTALALPPGPVASPKSPKNTPDFPRQKVIHNRRRP
jgi:hypothetical protein